MTRISCPGCRLRFARATAAYLTACPSCGGPLQRITAEQSIGLHLFSDDDGPDPLRQAAAAVLPVAPDAPPGVTVPWRPDAPQA